MQQQEMEVGTIVLLIGSACTMVLALKDGDWFLSMVIHSTSMVSMIQQSPMSIIRTLQ
jgi:hypothetical protein